MTLDRVALTSLHLTMYYVEQVVITDRGKINYEAWTAYNGITAYKLALNSVH